VKKKIYIFSCYSVKIRAAIWCCSCALTNRPKIPHSNRHNANAC